ncbi:hypothetical protein QN239_33225 [Mycolicibacterium sp. Y3]
MTDRRHMKNNAEKAAARQLQNRTGMGYREALSATRSTEAPHAEVTLEQLIGPFIGQTSSNVWELVEKLPEGSILTVHHAASLAAELRDAFRHELVAELVAGLRRKQLDIRLVIGGEALCRRAVSNYPDLETAGIKLQAADGSPVR